jgi:hypothetical protein
MNLDRIDEIIAKNITITDKRLYEGVFNAVLEAVNEENEACAKVCEDIPVPQGPTELTHIPTLERCAAAIRARSET